MPDLRKHGSVARSGKWADFIIVDRDVSAVDPQALARTQVLETWVAGKNVWERK
jgi:predicted amidohydrolase YtcJ